ncbi:MAG: hypothetical protein KAS82_00665 [Bacteroidales bacterium]|nr:hypothetical protein [Bacteroidales bacterium]
MSYVDLIIKYLSGDLSREEASSFEKELESNGELKREFEQQSAAYDLIRDQLQKRDEEVFRTKLQKAMSHELPLTEPRKMWLRTRWYIPMAAACALAIILSTLLSHPGNERVLARYYDPARDPVVLAYYQDTRGESEPGILHYRQGNYQRSMKLLSDRISEERENRQLQLYYLLSAIELDRQDEVMGMIVVNEPDSMDLPDQAITWYIALAHLKSGSREAALEKIHPLTEQHGPYQSDAIKLEKVLLK